VPPTNVV